MCLCLAERLQMTEDEAKAREWMIRQVSVGTFPRQLTNMVLISSALAFLAAIADHERPQCVCVCVCVSCVSYRYCSQRSVWVCDQGGTELQTGVWCCSHRLRSSIGCLSAADVCFANEAVLVWCHRIHLHSLNTHTHTHTCPRVLSPEVHTRELVLLVQFC